jgi:hypothetical protein
MSIKSLKPNKNSHYNQGFYKPINENKYVGPRPIIYRSGWEERFAYYCDTNKNILKWSSEPFGIKYFNLLDNKYHTYYPDFYIKVRKGELITEYVVEVKPSNQLKKPLYPKRKTPKALKGYYKARDTFVTNLCKRDALKKFAKLKNYEVMTVTEKCFLI